MKANIGTSERIIRLIVGAALMIYFFAFSQGAMRWLGCVGLVLVATALVSFCPLWSIFGLNSAKR